MSPDILKNNAVNIRINKYKINIMFKNNILLARIQYTGYVLFNYIKL